LPAITGLYSIEENGSHFVMTFSGDLAAILDVEWLVIFR
jgi:hypothetical protein